MDKLSQRLRREPTVSDEDLDRLAVVMQTYHEVGQEVRDRLVALGYEATVRTKSTTVLVDKLRRERTSIKSVHDIAGARIVQDCNRLEQDEIVAAIVSEFSDGSVPPRVKDRRENPSHGYRAVHVIVTVQDLPVEIQVRTTGQDLWAQLVEALGDRWGRGIRYGDPPPEPDKPSLGQMSRATIWEIVKEYSEQIAVTEGYLHRAAVLADDTEGRRSRQPLTEHEDQELLAQLTDIEELKTQFSESEAKLRETVKVLAEWARTSAE